MLVNSRLLAISSSARRTSFPLLSYIEGYKSDQTQPVASSGVRTLNPRHICTHRGRRPRALLVPVLFPPQRCCSEASPRTGIAKSRLQGQYICPMTNLVSGKDIAYRPFSRRYPLPLPSPTSTSYLVLRTDNAKPIISPNCGTTVLRGQVVQGLCLPIPAVSRTVGFRPRRRPLRCQNRHLQVRRNAPQALFLTGVHNHRSHHILP